MPSSAPYAFEFRETGICLPTTDACELGDSDIVRGWGICPTCLRLTHRNPNAMWWVEHGNTCFCRWVRYDGAEPSHRYHEPPTSTADAYNYIFNSGGTRLQRGEPRGLMGQRELNEHTTARMLREQPLGRRVGRDVVPYVNWNIVRILYSPPIDQPAIIEEESVVPRRPSTLQRQLGVELEFICPVDPFNYRVPHCELKNDGSLRPRRGSSHYTCEAVVSHTPAVTQLRRLSTVTTFLRNEMDAYTNASCGTHIHLDMAGETDETMRAIRDWYLALEKGIFALVPSGRRRNMYARPCSDYGLGQWWGDRYRALNVSAYDRHGTYEVRLHQGTINATKIKNWSSLFLHLFDKAPTLGDTTLARRIRDASARTQMAFLLRNVAPAALRPAILRRAKQYDPNTFPRKERTLIECAPSAAS